MKRVERLLILMIGLAAAGGLGYKFLPSFEPVKYIIFAIAILIGGEILYRIDECLSIRNRKR